MDQVENQKEQRKEPTISLPFGISPPIKAIVDQRIVNGRKEYLYAYYPTSSSLIDFNGWTSEEVLAKCGLPLSPPAGNEKSLDDSDSVKLKSYIKEQQELIARLIRIHCVIEALSADPVLPGNQREKKLLRKWYKETRKRRNRPSKDWTPYTRNYDLLLPQYAHVSGNEFLISHPVKTYPLM